LLLVTFIRIEGKSRYPMMPLGLFSNSTFSGANALSFFLYAGLGAGMLFLSLNLVQVQGYSQLESGLTFLPFTLLMISLSRYAGGLSDRLGARPLLVAGPATAGVGLLMLSFVRQTHGHSDYWTTFFPGIIVLGLGMTFTVAPLTAAVMGSVDQQFSGVASGVNNAMTRIASVFANAVFGALAVGFFAGALGERMASTAGTTGTVGTIGTTARVAMPAMSAMERKAVMAEAVNLGNARVPATVGDRDKPIVAAAYRDAFITAYANILRISAALAWCGALMAVVFVKRVRVT
jgi:MFS family permease